MARMYKFSMHLRAASFQANLMELGQTTSSGHSGLKAAAVARAWIVLPRPMSSAMYTRPLLSCDDGIQNTIQCFPLNATLLEPGKSVTISNCHIIPQFSRHMGPFVSFKTVTISVLQGWGRYFEKYLQ